MLKFEKFLKENDAKRQRANLKAQTERKLREQKEIELSVLQRQLENEHTKSEKIQRLLSMWIHDKWDFPPLGDRPISNTDTPHYRF